MDNVKVVAGGGVRPTALEVARSIDSRLLRVDSEFNVSGKTVLNWGSGDLNHINGIEGALKIINPPEAVSVASSKIATLEALKGEYAVEVTTDTSLALGWLIQGDVVVGRELDRGSGGRGIQIFKYSDAVDEALFRSCKLYTKYFKATREYRLHCGKHADGVYRCFDIQRKGLRTDEDRPTSANFYVRNHENGFTFVRSEEGLKCTMDERWQMQAICSLAVQQLGLDFGAVDVRINDSGVVKIIEVNTAPGLSGTTLANYTNYFETQWS